MGAHFTHVMILHAKIIGVPFMMISSESTIICKATVIMKHMVFDALPIP